MEPVGPQRWNIPSRFRIGWFLRIGATDVSRDSAPEKNLTAHPIERGKRLNPHTFHSPRLSPVLVSAAAADQILHGEQQQQAATPVPARFRISTIQAAA